MTSQRTRGIWVSVVLFFTVMLQALAVAATNEDVYSSVGQAAKVSNPSVTIDTSDKASSHAPALTWPIIAIAGAAWLRRRRR